MDAPAGTESELRIDTGDVELAAVESGDRSNATILLVHGFPDSRELWRHVTPLLSDRFHVVSYDVRGNGGSSAPAGGEAAYDLERLADDALAMIDAVSPDRPVHLVGHDWGAIQGWEFATSRRFAGRLASFTAVACPSLDQTAHLLRRRLRHPSPAGIAAIVSQLARSWYVGVFSVPGLAERIWPRLAPRWGDVLVRSEGVPAERVAVVPTLAADACRNLGLYRRNIRRRLRSPRPDPYAIVPVQVIVPTGDHFLARSTYDDIDLWVPDLRRTDIACGHWAPLVEPARIAGLLGDFVSEIESRP